MISRYVFGTTRLGDDSVPFDERVRIARLALDAGVWFHTSDQYGDALKVLREAFSGRRAPNLIFKIGWDSPSQIEAQARSQLETVGLPSMAIGQLCLSDEMVEKIAAGDAVIDELNQLKSGGLIDRFVWETWPWNSAGSLKAFKSGNLARLADAFIFYLNPLQRVVSNDLWDAITQENYPVIAMRTVCGGDINRLLDPESDAPQYQRDRAPEIEPIFERSGCTSWVEFSARYALSFANVQGSVGATNKQSHLEDFLDTVPGAQTLTPELRDEVASLQRRWADEFDSHAEKWTM